MKPCQEGKALIQTRSEYIYSLAVVGRRKMPTINRDKLRQITDQDASRLRSAIMDRMDRLVSRSSELPDKYVETELAAYKELLEMLGGQTKWPA